jgi:hypothetical protein
MLLLIVKRRRLECRQLSREHLARHRNRRQLKEAQLEMPFEATELPSCEILIFVSR